MLPLLIYRQMFKAFWKILLIDEITRFTPCDFEKNVQCCPFVIYREIFKAFFGKYLLMKLQGLPLVIFCLMCNAAPL